MRVLMFIYENYFYSKSLQSGLGHTTINKLFRVMNISDMAEQTFKKCERQMGPIYPGGSTWTGCPALLRSKIRSISSGLRRWRKGRRSSPPGKCRTIRRIDTVETYFWTRFRTTNYHGSWWYPKSMGLESWKIRTELRRTATFRSREDL